MHSAAILAGGQARRFGGRDKSAMLVDGRTILDRQVAELTRITADILLVGVRATPDTPRAVRAVEDDVPGRGPLGGLHTALAACRGDALVLVACDMPFVTAPLLAHLLALTADADVVVPRTDRGYHPLCAAYTQACRDAVARRLTDDRLRMTDLFEDVRVREVTKEEIGAFGDADRLLANVNTPAELASLEALQGHKP